PRPEATREAGPREPAPPPRPGRPPAGAAHCQSQRLSRPSRSASTPHRRAATATAARPRPGRLAGSWGLLALPDLADQPQPTLHRARATAQPRRDPLDRVALHLPPRDRPHLGVAQPAQQQPSRLGHLGGELRRRLPADELVQPLRRRIVGAEQPRLADDTAAATLLASLVADQVVGLAFGEGDQQPPQGVAVSQAGGAAGPGGAAE